MEKDGYLVFDGSQIRNVLPDVEAQVTKKFLELDAEGRGLLTGADAKAVAEAQASGPLQGVEVQAERLDRIFVSVAELEAELSKDEFWIVVEKYLLALADDLDEKPLVCSSLDGSTIMSVLQDEDDFAMLAENLFMQLDTDENGKLSRSELQPAILKLGVELGVPTSAAKPDEDQLLNELFKKHGAEGTEELGQTQFANLLQEMLEDLAASLKKNPVIVVQDGLNLSEITPTPVLKEFIEDEVKLDAITEGFFVGLDVNRDGILTKEEVKPFFLLDSQGLPPMVADQRAKAMIDTVFPEKDPEHAGEISKTDFKDFMQAVLEKYVENDTPLPDTERA